MSKKEEKEKQNQKEQQICEAETSNCRRKTQNRHTYIHKRTKKQKIENRATNEREEYWIVVC